MTITACQPAPTSTSPIPSRAAATPAAATRPRAPRALRKPCPFSPGPARRLPGERIAAAAIIDPRSGEIVEGACHSDAMARAGIAWEEITPDLADWIAAHEGFTTTFGRFVTREAAAGIARSCGMAVTGPLKSEQLVA